jgi:hypothetical protein
MVVLVLRHLYREFGLSEKCQALSGNSDSLLKEGQRPTNEPLFFLRMI